MLVFELFSANEANLRRQMMEERDFHDVIRITHCRFDLCLGEGIFFSFSYSSWFTFIFQSHTDAVRTAKAASVSLRCLLFVCVVRHHPEDKVTAWDRRSSEIPSGVRPGNIRADSRNKHWQIPQSASGTAGLHVWVSSVRVHRKLASPRVKQIKKRNLLSFSVAIGF